MYSITFFYSCEVTNMNKQKELHRIPSKGAISKISKYLIVVATLLLMCGLFSACAKTPPETVEPEIPEDEEPGTTPEKPEEPEEPQEPVPDEPKVFAPKNVIMISVQDLGDGMIGGDYYGTPLTPGLNGLLSDFSFYKNNISSSKSAAKCRKPNLPPQHWPASEQCLLPKSA